MNKLGMKETAKWEKIGWEKKKTVQSPAFRNIWANSEGTFRVCGSVHLQSLK